MQGALGTPWTDFVTLEGSTHEQPLHWRLLDGARLRLAGSNRQWKAHLIPLGVPEPGSAGFELHLVAEEPLPAAEAPAEETPRPTFSTAIGREIAPVLRQPIARIIANAETIRTQLAGPLAEEYSNYAADISSAGEHLLALIDDLADLEVVEDDQFTTAPDQIDLADVARRAVGILGVRAQERGIAIDAPKPGESALAVGEFRRVLQILLNLVGNAIRYAPEGSEIWVRVEPDGGRARIVVADQGEGLSEAQQARVFEKFERLGRSDSGGSGLGLYISRRLARAMDGDLTVESAPGQGARFILELPAFDDRRAEPR
jgi:signal transduction histidine kinase